VYLRPLPITRALNGLLPLLLIPFGLEQFGVRLLPLLIVVAGWLGVRGFRLGVVLGDGELVVRGFLWSRHIAAKDIQEITVFPAVRWVSGGRSRWSPIVAFADAGAMATRVNANNEYIIEQIEDWLHRQRRS